MPLISVWHVPEDNAYVLMKIDSVQTVPRVLKKYGRPLREVLPGETVDSLDWEDIDTNALVAKYCLGTAPVDQLEAVRADVKARAKTDKKVFYDEIARLDRC